MDESWSSGRITGYLAADLERFVAAADARVGALESAIAAERARRELAERDEAAATTRRRQIAEAWATALHDAEAIRAAADADANDTLERAAQSARAIHARAQLERRANAHALTTHSGVR